MKRISKPPFTKFQQRPSPYDKIQLEERKVDDAIINKLFEVVMRGNQQEIREFISKYNVSPSVRNSNGQSVLHIVIDQETLNKEEKYQLVEFLLTLGAPVSAYDMNNVTALHLASKYQLDKIVELLLKHGAVPNSQDNQGKTPIHYAVMGDVTTCKPSSKIKSLIPKESLVGMTENITQELRRLMLIIMEKFYSTDPNRYIKHMRNTLTQIPDMFPDNIDNIINKFREAVSNILTEPILDSEKQKKIETQMVTHIKEVETIVRNNLGKSIEPLPIKTYQIDGWSPDPTIESTKVLPKIAEEDSITGIEKERVGKVSQLFEYNLLKKIDDLDKSIVDGAEGVKNIYSSMNKIHQFWHCIAVNVYGDDNLDQKHRKKRVIAIDNLIRQAYLHNEIYNDDDTKNMGIGTIPVINIEDAVGGIYDIPSNVMFEETTTPKIIRGTKKEISEWRKQNLQITTYPLTNDINAYTAGYIISGPILPDYNKKLYPSIIHEEFKQTLNDGKKYAYYFLTKILFNLNKIRYYGILIKNNTIRIMWHIKETPKPFLYQVYHKFLTDTITSILDICQCLAFIRDEISNVYSIHNEKIAGFIEKIKEDIHNPADAEANPAKWAKAYEYLIENIQDQYNSTISVFNNLLNSKADVIYQNIRNVMGVLNDYIQLINITSASMLLTSYHSEAVLFNSNTIGEITHVYDRPFKNINLIPESLDAYMKLYVVKFPNIKDINGYVNIKKKLIETYLLQIHSKNYMSYYTSGTMKLQKHRTRTGEQITYDEYDNINNLPNLKNMNMTDDIYTFRYQLYSKGAGTTEIISPDIYLSPISGFLLPVLTFDDIDSPAKALKDNIIFKYENKYIPDTTDPSNVNKATLWELQDNPPEYPPKIGRIGLKQGLTNRRKEELIFPSIAPFIGKHYYLIKYELIKWLLEQFKNNIDNRIKTLPLAVSNDKIDILIDDINRKSLNKFNDDNEKKGILYAMIAKLTDELIIYFINTIVQKESTKLILQILGQIDAKTADYYSNLMKGTGAMADSINLLIKDTGTNFELRLNSLFEDVINYFIINPTPAVASRMDIRMLSHTSQVVEDESNNSEQYKIYDFSSSTSKTEDACVKINTDIINILAKASANINEKDTDGNPPINFLIQLQHIPAIKVLLNMNATVNTNAVRNINNETPLDYAISLYKQHLQMMCNQQEVKNIIRKLTEPIFETLKEQLKDTPQYGNNILRFLNLIFPQLILIYNHYLYSRTKQYAGNWTLKKTQELIKLCKKYVILDQSVEETNPILTIDLNTIKSETGSTHVMKAYEKELHEKLEALEKEIKALDNALNNLDEENKTAKPSRQTEITKIKAELTNTRTTKQTTLTEYQKLLDANTGNVTIARNTIEASKLTYLENAITAKKSSILEYDVPKNYQDIFEQIISTQYGTKYEYKGYADYRTYNKLWQMYIADDKKLINLTNIHPVLTIIQYKMLEEYKNKKITTKDLYEGLNIIFSFHSGIIKPFCMNYLQLPNDDTDSNPSLKVVMDIIIHVISHTICSGLYQVLIKALTEYVISLNPRRIGKTDISIYDSATSTSEQNYSEYINRIVRDIIITGKGGQSKLEEYVNKDLPEKLVKHILHIYDNDYDPDRKYNSVDELLTVASDIIMTNTSLPINDNSSFMINLKKYIFPYFEDIMQKFVLQSKILIDNYNRLLVSEYRHLDIIITLLEQATKEKI